MCENEKNQSEIIGELNVNDPPKAGKKESNNPPNTELIIEMLNVYLQEFIHRDKHMWSQNYKFFFASLVVMFLPNLTERFGITIPEIFSSNDWIFPVIGIALAIVFLYISLGLAKRFRAISDTYNNLINLLPNELKRTSIRNMHMKFLNRSHVYILPVFMFAALIILGVLMLI